MSQATRVSDVRWNIPYGTYKHEHLNLAANQVLLAYTLTINPVDEQQPDLDSFWMHSKEFWPSDNRAAHEYEERILFLRNREIPKLEDTLMQNPAIARELGSISSRSVYVFRKQGASSNVFEEINWWYVRKNSRRQAFFMIHDETIANGIYTPHPVEIAKKG